MYDFFFGFFFGAILTKFIKRPKKNVQTQADELVIQYYQESKPIDIKHSSF
jgi:hypothetical protein